MQQSVLRLLILFLFISKLLFADGNRETDSLESLLPSCKTDTARVSILLKLARIYVNIDVNKARTCINQVIQLSDKPDIDKVKVFFVVGKIEESSGDLAQAMTNYFKALQLAETRHENESDVAEILDKMGGVYLLQQNYKQAINYRTKAIQLSKKLNDTEDVAIATFNLGNVYYYMSDESQALTKYLEALPLFEKLKNDNYVDAAYNNIGALYFNQKAYDKALVYFKKSYRSRLQTNRAADIASSLNNVGETFQKLGQTDSALQYCMRGYKLADSSGLYDIIIATAQNLALLYESKNDFKEANYYMHVYESVKDSVFNTESQKQLQEMSVKYESEKKEKENEILTLQLRNESFTKYISMGVAVFVLLLAALIYRSYRQKKNANEILSEKNHIIEEQHKDITDSIRYAQRIQQAILPPDRLWFEVLPDSFVLYKPKDILSGDFYWIEKKDDHIYVAAADCTGHGVPGALMSVVNFNLLNKAVLEQQLATPNAILDAVNHWLTIALHQTYNDSAVRDGMDIALCSINQKTNELHFAGAYNGAYLFKQDGSFFELHGDKLPVGSFIEDKMRSFSDNMVSLQSGDRIYIFSDGYADQFGGPKGKKLKYINLKNYIQESLALSMSQQKEFLDRKFEEWKGHREQVDDVLVIGIRIA